MATNSFVSNDNKALLWEMMLTNNMFNGVPDDNFQNVKIMFENVIMRLGQTIKSDISRDELLSLNKTAILEIKTNLDIFKKKNNQDTFNNEKILVFDKNLESARNDFSETIAIKKPEQPEFTSKADTPIATNSMNELLEKLQREREQLLPPPPANPHSSEEQRQQQTQQQTQLQDIPIKKPLIIENPEPENSLKKLSNIEELFAINISDTQPSTSKRVSFNNNPISENTIVGNNIHNKILGENTPNLINQEYRGERKINDNLKLNSIFNLLKEIDKKQDEIIQILKSS